MLQTNFEPSKNCKGNHDSHLIDYLLLNHFYHCPKRDKC